MNIKPGMPIPQPLYEIVREALGRDPVISDKIYLDGIGLSEDKKEEIIKQCEKSGIRVEFVMKAWNCIVPPPTTDLEKLFRTESKPHYRYVDYLQKKYKRKGKI